MIAARRPFNGTFILLLGIHQKFTDSGVKQSFSFTLYIKILKNRGNIGYSFFVFISDKLSFNHFFDCCKQLIVRLVCRNIRILSLDRIGTLK